VRVRLHMRASPLCGWVGGCFRARSIICLLHILDAVGDSALPRYSTYPDIVLQTIKPQRALAMREHFNERCRIAKLSLSDRTPKKLHSAIESQCIIFCAYRFCRKVCQVGHPLSDPIFFPPVFHFPMALNFFAYPISLSRRPATGERF
jgi:hypothetical protein